MILLNDSARKAGHVRARSTGKCGVIGRVVHMTIRSNKKCASCMFPGRKRAGPSPGHSCDRCFRPFS